MALNFLYLRAFHAVASERSFTRAAEILRVSQSTLSSQVKALEERCGVRLLDRGHTVEPTPTGRALLKLTREIFRIQDEIESMLTRDRQLDEGKLNIGADGPRHIIPIISRFFHLHPNLSVSLITGNAAKVLTDLLNSETDVAIVALPKPLHSRLYTVPFRTYPLLAFVARDHPWAGRTTVRLDDFRNQPLLVREPTSMTRQMLLRALTHAKARPATLIEIDNREATREAVALGMGVGVMSATEFPSKDKRTVPLSIEDETLTITEYVACLAKKRKRRAVQEFFRLCAQFVEAHPIGETCRAGRG
jgi:LysR family transcriptional regulator, low CO2-responsive transcriptional regulator